MNSTAAALANWTASPLRPRQQYSFADLRPPQGAFAAGGVNVIDAGRKIAWSKIARSRWGVIEAGSSSGESDEESDAAASDIESDTLRSSHNSQLAASGSLQHSQLPPPAAPALHAPAAAQSAQTDAERRGEE